MRPVIECLGIDPSSAKLALVWEEENYLKMRTFALPSVATWEVRCAVAFAIMSKFFYDYDVRSVYVEAPVFGRGGPGATLPQAMVTGSILAACGEWKIPFSKLVNNTTWKKRILGNGAMSKPEIAEAMRELWPRASRKAGGDQDLIDAAGVYQYGLAYNRIRRHFLRARKRKAA